MSRSNPSAATRERLKQQQRNAQYQQLFNLPEDEELVDEFNCALKGKVLLQGKLYISQNFACFYANIFGHETVKILPASDITGVQMAKMLIFPNSIKVFLTYETYFFTSFLHRDDAWRLLTKISRGESIAHMGAHRPGEAAEEDNEKSGNSRNGSGQEDEDDRSPMSRTGPRSPLGQSSKIRHASLLSQNASRLEAEQEKKRKDALLEAKKKLQATPESAENSRSTRGSDESEEDDAPPPPRRGKNATASPATKKPPPRKAASKHSDSGSDNEQSAQSRSASPMPPKKGAQKKKQYSDSEAQSADEGEEEVDEPPTHGRKKSQQLNGKSSSSSSSSSAFLAASLNSNFTLPRTAALKQAKFYEFDSKSPDPTIVDIQSKFKTKSLNLDGPSSSSSTSTTSSSAATTYRRLVHQGVMKRQGGWAVVDRWCFLFHDFFLFTEYDAKKQKDYKEKQRIELQHMEVDMRPLSFQQAELKKTKLTNVFRLLDNNPKGPPCQYVCSVLTAQERLDWAKYFTSAISRWHMNPASNSKVDMKKAGWYTQFVRGTLGHALIAKDEALLINLLREPAQKDLINVIDQEGNSLLHLCILNSTPQFIPILLNHGADIRLRDFNNYTPLHLAVIHADLTSFQTLMANKSMDLGVWHPIQPKEPKVLREKSALWLAAVIHHRSNPDAADEIIRTLYSSVKNMPSFLDERSEKNSMTLLDYCCLNPGMEQIAALIIELGATIDLPNLDGLTPLIQACKSANIPMITLLLQSGAQPNLRHGRTNFNSAIFHCRGPSGLDCARELVRYGARWSDVKNREGQRPKDIFPSISQQNFLKQAEDVWQNQKATSIDNTVDSMKPPANSMPQNNRHDFDSCCICQMEFTLVNKRDYCRRCGWNICGPCSSKRMAFISSSKGRSRNSASTGGMKERVCDGCYNLVAHRKRASAKKKPIAPKIDSDNDEEIEERKSNKSKGKAAGRSVDDDDDDDDSTKSPPVASKRAEASMKKSIKRVDVDSDPDASDSDRDQSADEPPTDDSDRSDAEDTKTKAQIAADKQKASSQDKPSLGSRFLAKLSFKKTDPVAVAKQESAKHAKLAKKKGRESEEEDDNYEEGKKSKKTASRSGASSALAIGTPNGKSKSRPAADDDDDDDDDDEARASSARPNGKANGTPKKSPAKKKPQSDDDEDDDGSRTDSGGDADDMAEDWNAPKKENFFERGFKSATNAVKTAGGAVGGAMTSMARGVKNVATNIQEKVITRGRSPSDAEEDEDPMAASRARRKEAARQRLASKYGKPADDDDEEEEEEEVQDLMPASKKGASTMAKMSDAKRQAQRNQDLLYQMEDRGQELEDEGREFASLTAKLKAKAKKSKF